MQSQQTLIMRQSLELGAELGQGEFGSVLKGVWTDPKGKKVWYCVVFKWSCTASGNRGL